MTTIKLYYIIILKLYIWLYFYASFLQWFTKYYVVLVSNPNSKPRFDVSLSFQSQNSNLGKKPKLCFACKCNWCIIKFIAILL